MDMNVKTLKYLDFNDFECEVMKDCIVKGINFYSLENAIFGGHFSSFPYVEFDIEEIEEHLFYMNEMSLWYGAVKPKLIELGFSDYVTFYIGY